MTLDSLMLEQFASMKVGVQETLPNVLPDLV
jgi:hypothetical protein